MAKETPDNTNNPTKMSFNKFRDWASGYILIRLGAGDNLQGIHVILDHAARNEQFGGAKNGS